MSPWAATALGLLLLGAPAPRRAAAPKPAPPVSLLEPVQLSGDALQLRQREHVAVYTGHVVAVRRDATVRCDVLAGWFDASNQLLRLECVGQAEAVQGDTRITGARADFDNVTGKIVVTGEPRATRAGVQLQARRFTYDTVRDELLGDEPTTHADNTGSDGKPVSIRARSLRVDRARGTAVWTGDVRVLRSGATVKCDRLVARSGPDGRLQKAACTGHARMDMDDRWAVGERADYDVSAARVWVTGNPMAGDGANEMTGSRFTLDLEQRTLAGENVRAKVDGAAARAKGKGKR
ncbi:MAG: hypothetical protein RL653_3611 [Pseudomonadota bacterium]